MAGSTAVDTDNGLTWTNHRRSLPCVRVVAGDLRGRRIEAPTTEATRPTTDKVREAVFNSLRSMDVVEGARVLDLFAGTGAMGIEALSRGAAHCVFVESDRAALAVLRTNLQKLGIADKSTVISGDAVMQASQQQGIDLLIADPPYGYNDWARLLVGVTAGLVVLESDREVGDIEGWQTVRVKKYGRTHVAFLQCQTTPAGTVEGE
jgi:16S rRNA (guanine966-N2)-methyltransferase